MTSDYPKNHTQFSVIVLRNIGKIKHVSQSLILTLFSVFNCNNEIQKSMFLKHGRINPSELKLSTYLLFLNYSRF